MDQVGGMMKAGMAGTSKEPKIQPPTKTPSLEKQTNQNLGHDQ